MKAKKPTLFTLSNLAIFLILFILSTCGFYRPKEILQPLNENTLYQQNIFSNPKGIQETLEEGLEINSGASRPINETSSEVNPIQEQINVEVPELGTFELGKIYAQIENSSIGYVQTESITATPVDTVNLLIVIENPELNNVGTVIQGYGYSGFWYNGTGLETEFKKLDNYTNENYYLCTASYTGSMTILFSYKESNQTVIQDYAQLVIETLQANKIYYENDQGLLTNQNDEATVTYIPGNNLIIQASVQNPELDSQGLVLSGENGSGFYYYPNGNQSGQKVWLETTWVNTGIGGFWEGRANIEATICPQTIYLALKEYGKNQNPNVAQLRVEVNNPEKLNEIFVWNSNKNQYESGDYTATVNEPITLIYSEEETQQGIVELKVKNNNQTYPLEPYKTIICSDGSKLYIYSFVPSEGTYEISYGTSKLTITAKYYITVTDMKFGTTGPFSANIDVATRMVNGSNTTIGTSKNTVVNSPETPYILYVGDYLNLNVEESNVTFSNSATGILQEIVYSGNDNSSIIQYQAMETGTDSISAIVDGTSVETFYIKVLFPINVQTGIHEGNTYQFMNKDYLHEYVRTVGNATYSYNDFIFDPEGNALYFKNGGGYLMEYQAVNDQIITLQGICPKGTYGYGDGEYHFYALYGDVDVIIEESESIVGDFDYVTITYQIKDSDSFKVITFGNQSNYVSFFITVPTNANAQHYDIEVLDGAKWNAGTTTILYSTRNVEFEEQNYQAEITEVHGSKVYGNTSLNLNPLTTLEWWEYWHRYSSYDDENTPADAQDEFTSAYYTYPYMDDVLDDSLYVPDSNISINDYPLVRWLIENPYNPANIAKTDESALNAFLFNSEVVIFSKNPYLVSNNLESDSSALGSWSTRVQPIQKIEKVDFDVDVRLTELSEQFDTETVALDSENTEGLLLENFTVSMTGQNIYDAWNKCPNHSGLDFVTDLDNNLLKVILVGKKQIDGREWDESIDNEVYSFTLTPFETNGPGCELTSPVTVFNNGQDITFPEVLFYKPGTFSFTLEEDLLGEQAPVNISRDESKITVKITVNDDLKGGVIVFENSEGEEIYSDGLFLFTNVYKAPEPPEPPVEGTGDLIISKTVRGNEGSQTTPFTFKVTFDPDDEYAYTMNNGTTGTISSGKTFTLTSGQYITIEDIPVGTKYTVTEIEANQNGYSTRFTNSSGTIEDEEVIQASFINFKGSTTPNSPPNTPNTPDDPNTPDKPDEPDTPDTPNKPDKPNTPDTPNKPDEPNTPDTPNNPQEPNNPEIPDQTPDTNPSQPTNPGNTSVQGPNVSVVSYESPKTGVEDSVNIWIVVFTLACITWIIIKQKKIKSEK